MRYRELGKTRLRVSEIGFGCGDVGGLMVRGSYDEQLQGVSRAIKLDINYFDTAPSYGYGLSETNLGRALQELHPKDVVVATKVGIRTKDLKNIRGAVQKSLKESLRRLNRESVDVFQLHTPVGLIREARLGTLGLEDVLSSGGVADAFDEARSQGLIRFSGFTGLGETEALHKIVASDRFDVVQAYYNLLNPSAGFSVPSGFVGNDFKLLIRKASEKKMGVVVIRVLAGGALGGEVARQGHATPSVGSAITKGANYKTDTDRAKKLQFLISGAIKSLPQAGIRFDLMNKEISTVLVGYSNINQIDEAASCSVEEPFPKAWIDKLQDLWASDFRKS